MCKVHLFWKCHKSLRNLPHGLNIYLVNVETMRKLFRAIFVAFSSKLNFKNVQHITSAPSNSKTEVTLKQSDIDGNTSCTICTYSIICFSQVQPLCLVYWNHCYVLWNLTLMLTRLLQNSIFQKTWSNQKNNCTLSCEMSTKNSNATLQWLWIAIC
jgi:hypothetical protein